MNEIAGIPYSEARFDKDGNIEQAVDLPPQAAKVIVISHGWNNDPAEARELYRRFFDSFGNAAASLAIVGVIWPSKKFDGGPADDIAARLDCMKHTFQEPLEHRTLDEMKPLIQNLDDKASARRAFADMTRSLLTPSGANDEDASDNFFRMDGDQLMRNLRAHEMHTAGLIPSGFCAAALNVLNFASYYEMKTRAGIVGKGLAQLIDSFGPSVAEFHLVGHSFGGRLVTSAAAHSLTDRIASLSLLQAAFSHNGFSRIKGGFFRGVVDQRRVSGPVLVTHTPNDKAVGLAYPLASRISGDRTTMLGDAHDRYGAIGRNGARFMESGESVEAKLLPDGAHYLFQAGRFFNLESSAYIRSHEDVTGREVVHAVRSAISA